VSPTASTIVVKILRDWAYHTLCWISTFVSLQQNFI